ncbi:hypothetical protein [Orenia metallireducens]|nr:hypothetical protein [Orenia metallireducens]
MKGLNEKELIDIDGGGFWAGFSASVAIDAVSEMITGRSVASNVARGIKNYVIPAANESARRQHESGTWYSR